MSTNITISPNNLSWFDTGISLVENSTVTMTARGTVRIGDHNNQEVSAGGFEGIKNTDCVVPNLTSHALVAKIGDGDPFEVQGCTDRIVDRTGNLFMVFNDTGGDKHFNDNTDQFEVEISTKNGSPTFFEDFTGTKGHTQAIGNTLGVGFTLSSGSVDHVNNVNGTSGDFLQAGRAGAATGVIESKIGFAQGSYVIQLRVRGRIQHLSSDEKDRVEVDFGGKKAVHELNYYDDWTEVNSSVVVDQLSLLKISLPVTAGNEGLFLDWVKVVATS